MYRRYWVTGSRPALASLYKRLRSTVLPTPRRPISKSLRTESQLHMRSSAMDEASIMSARPASSGEGVPTPGAKGFIIGSMIKQVYIGLSGIDKTI